MDTTASETTPPRVLRELEIFGERTEIPRALVFHLSVRHQERSVNSEDGTVDDRVLEMETREIVTDTDTIRDREVPIVPVT